MYAFEIARPSSIAEAAGALQGEGAQALGGGQTLIPSLKQRLASPALLVSLTAIPEMRGVCLTDDGALAVGGATPHAQVARDARAHFPALADLAGHIGDPAVRNRGTIGGSLANNDPSACYPAAALGTGAVIITDRRQIAADDYFQGMFATALHDGEIITEVRLPIPARAHYRKFVQPASRFALVGVFVAQYAGGVRVAVTGASESGVYRWEAAEAALAGDFTPGAIAGLEAEADGLIGDLHASPAYRAHLVRVMTMRAVEAAA
jgi:carbon-monoxide dehydrogenase medium subunit